MATNFLQTRADNAVNTAKGFAHPLCAARGDKLQSLSGVLLGLFLVMHLHFESSMLLGKEAFYQVVPFLEGGVFSETGYGYPLLTQIFSTLYYWSCGSTRDLHYAVFLLN
jgi:fumarate reductase subunit C